MSLLNDRRSLLISNTDILPSIYRRLEYIENTGTQYIDTDYIPNNNMSIDIVYKAIDYTSSQYIAGARAGSYATIEFALNGSNSRTDWDIRFTGSVIYGNTYNVNGRNDHKWQSKVSMTNGTGNWEITDLDELATKKISFNNKAVTTSSNLMLFAYNSSVIHRNLRIYGCKIYDGKTLARDFIPCYRKADSVAGLYDLVNGKFYTNAGTGKFIVGGEV